MSQFVSDELLVPLALPLAHYALTYSCDRKRFLKASRRAATQMTAFGTGWQVDGHTSTRLFLKRVVPTPENMGISLQAEFDVSFEGLKVTVSTLTRLESEVKIFKDFTALVQQNLDQMFPRVQLK